MVMMAQAGLRSGACHGRDRMLATATAFFSEQRFGTSRPSRTHSRHGTDSSLDRPLSGRSRVHTGRDLRRAGFGPFFVRRDLRCSIGPEVPRPSDGTAIPWLGSRVVAPAEVPESAELSALSFVPPAICVAPGSVRFSPVRSPAETAAKASGTPPSGESGPFHGIKARHAALRLGRPCTACTVCSDFTGITGLFDFAGPGGDSSGSDCSRGGCWIIIEFSGAGSKLRIDWQSLYSITHPINRSSQ
jgi:hypothetical protein